jgi:hypothetical protein
MTFKQSVMTIAMLFGASAAPLAVHAATSTEAPATPPSVLAFDQTLKDNSVMLDYVRLPHQGYVAIYKVGKDGKPAGEVIGYTSLEPGYHRQLKVKLKKAPASGEQLWIALYKDKDNNPSFDPGAGDKPLWQRTQLPPESMITVR